MARTTLRTAALALAFAALLLTAKGRAQSALPADFLASQQNERGEHCDRWAEQQEGQRLLLACGAAGVWQIALDPGGPRFVQSFEFRGSAVGFFKEPNGRVWVKLEVLEARPVPLGQAGPSAQARVEFPEAAALLAPPESTPAPPPRPAAAPVASRPEPAPAAAPGRRSGRVLRATAGVVWISLGAADGVEPRDRVAFYSSPSAGDDEPNDSSGEVLAVGVVTRLRDHAAGVELGVNESVPVGAAASITRGPPTASLSAPPRAQGLWAMSLTARAFAAVGELGGGLLLSGSVGRRFTLPLHVQAYVDPFAFAGAENRDGTGARNAALLASYDSQYVELGFGLGAQTVRAVDFSLQVGSGWAFAQLLRLGAEDGLNIAARTSLVLFHSRFAFGGMVANLQVPVSRGYWFMLGGGGGDLGYGYGELGLRTLIGGNGQAGSKFLLLTAGGAGLFRDSGCFDCFQSQVSYAGPMVGIGGEWRL